MTLATLKQVLAKAQKGRYAVGAFNVNNLELLQGILRGAEKQHSPVIVSTSEGALEYAGLSSLFSLMKTEALQARVPVVIHLDHGRDWGVIQAAIKIGYTSVMFDGSHLPFEENIRQTRRVVKLAHSKGVSVEAELGTIGGAEDKVEARQIILAEPAAAEEFVAKTGIDALAAAIGTSHGAYKFAGKDKLDIPRLQQIRRRVSVPLVLHGASMLPPALLAQAKAAGAQLSGAQGVPESQIKAAVRHGVCKVNTDTDLRIAFTTALRKVAREKPTEFDPRKFLGPARDEVQKTVETHVRLFGCAGKA